ncbi:MAG: PAS domain-containing protein [Betaproteobacteria bacterium]
MNGSYHIGLVLLSIAVAVVASYVALDLASRVSAASGRAAAYWLAGGALAMGSGIWSMHFIGMLAFRLPIAMSYDVRITLMSMLIAVLVSAFALFTINRNTLSTPRLLLSGVLMGAGIAAMHYSGMAAMQISPAIDYNLLLFAASIAIAIGAAVVALWIAFRLRSDSVAHVLPKRAGSALVMGVAIAGMHYTGMAAASFAGDSICLGNPSAISQVGLGAIIAVCTGFGLAVTMLVSVFDSRMASNIAKLAESLRTANGLLSKEIAERERGEKTLRREHIDLQQMLDAIPTPILVKDRQYRFVFVNRSARALTGQGETQMIGKTDYDFNPKAHADVFRAQDDTVFSTREESINEEVITDNRGQSRTLLTRKAVFKDLAGHDVLVAVITDISELKRATAEAEHSRGFLDSVLNALPQPIFVKDSQSRWIHVNTAGYQRYGLTRAEMLGKDDTFVHTPNEAAVRMAEDQRVLASGEPLVIEQREVLPGAQIAWALKSKTPITLPDGSRVIVGILADITERKNAEIELASSQRFLEVLINALPNPILVKDSEHRFVRVNAAFCRLMGRTQEELIGKTNADVQPPEMAQAVYAEDDQALATEETLFFERKSLGPQGQNVWGIASKRAISAPDGKRLVVGLIADVTALKQSELDLIGTNVELTQINQVLVDAQNQLLQSEKMASIGQLAAGVAHEINNPIGFVYSNLGTLDGYLRDLFSLMGAYEKLEDAPTPADVAYVHELKDSVDLAFLRTDIPELMKESRDGITRVKNIVQNLKECSHQDQAEKWQWARLQDGLESTLTIVNNEIKYKANLVKEYAELPQIQCLASQINQVFMNLLVNAAHAIEQSGTITLRTGQQAEEVWVEIADSGCGITPANLKRIFDPFFTTKPVGKGTGLGLSLSYAIVQKHHGRIEVRSELGKGTAFRVVLPVRQEHAGAELALA